MTIQPITPPGAAHELPSLLDDHEADSLFFLASPRRTMLANGVRAAVPSSAGTAVEELAEQALDILVRLAAPDSEPPTLVGAIPFAGTTPASLRIARRCRWSAPLPPGAAPAGAPPLAARVTPIPPPADYVAAVRRAVRELADGELRKVVLARSLHARLPDPVNTGDLLRRLAARNPHGYVFATELTHDGDHPKMLLGATPELLVSRSHNRVVSNPLAGSAARGADEDEDRRRAAALLASEKDRHEHRLVVEAVAAALRPLCSHLDVPSEPSLVRTSTMWHLSTRIRGLLRNPAPSALAVAAALHPTPAVCGSPTAAARNAIARLEGFDRGFYTGLVGWMRPSGDGEWVIALRCGETDGPDLRLYAGAGIVAESDPEAELAETTAKFRTLLSAIGLDQPVVSAVSLRDTRTRGEG